MRQVLFVIAASGFLAPAALAQDDEPGLTFDASLGVVSDYRYRGLSLSNEGPAVQLDATLASDSGIYGNLFVSTIDEYGADAAGEGAQVEVDYTLGWAFAVADFEVDLAVSAYTYPGGTDVDYLTLPVSISRSFDAWSVTLGYEYSPSQPNLGDTDGSYAWLGADWADEISGFSLTGWVGYEGGAWAPDGKTDWGVGGYKSFDNLELGLLLQGVDVEDGVTLISSLTFSS
jgi:uncharacterized protein (TIGR02001 family)